MFSICTYSTGWKATIYNYLIILQIKASMILNQISSSIGRSFFAEGTSCLGLLAVGGNTFSAKNQTNSSENKWVFNPLG